MKNTEQGVCPKCKKSDLEWLEIELQEETVGYPYQCNDCGFKGTEWYSLQFICHTTDKKDGPIN